jgi:hypothetical protein
MPYFLNAPASMAMNSGDYKSETAGTATLITLSGASAPSALAWGASNKTARGRKIVHRFMGRSCAKLA